MKNIKQQWEIDLENALNGISNEEKLIQIDREIARYSGGKTGGYINKANGTLSKAGKASATKQWNENRENELKKSSLGGKTAYEQKKGVHSLNYLQRFENGKKGYYNGLGKLSLDEKINIASNAGLKNRELNSKFTIEDVIFMRENFIPRHPEFGVVAFSKKYGASEGAVRRAIKGNSFKDI
jgi:hypothetical protein